MIEIIPGSRCDLPETTMITGGLDLVYTLLNSYHVPFYLIGSRSLYGMNELDHYCDWDFMAAASDEVEQYLRSNQFSPINGDHGVSYVPNHMRQGIRTVLRRLVAETNVDVILVEHINWRLDIIRKVLQIGRESAVTRRGRSVVQTLQGNNLGPDLDEYAEILRSAAFWSVAEAVYEQGMQNGGVPCNSQWPDRVQRVAQREDSPSNTDQSSGLPRSVTTGIDSV